MCCQFRGLFLIHSWRTNFHNDLSPRLGHSNGVYKCRLMRMNRHSRSEGKCLLGCVLKINDGSIWPSLAGNNVFLAGFLLVFIVASSIAEEPLLRPHDRIAICGDQITANQGYALTLADYLTMCEGVEDLD